jgi:hypothetical protein
MSITYRLIMYSVVCLCVLMSFTVLLFLAPPYGGVTMVTWCLENMMMIS